MRSPAVCCLAVTLLGTSVATSAPPHGRVDFNRDVRPILSDNCYFCHGPDAGHREADLRLDIRDDALAGEAFVPGDAKASKLVARILSTDTDEVMPPPASRKKLTDEQKQILERWVAEGAEYAPHWAYRAPVRPETPAGMNPLDALVRKTLEANGLSPSPEADRRTLLRRLSSDLIGLPPTPEEVASFEADTAPGAYERQVERLLKQPQYGERMALGWLDVVRYADTIGYHSDTPRNVWPYRDWVIRSFNENKPFDRFTIEQIAGDLLPDANQETRVGSAFNRLLLSTEEGGAQPKDYESRMLTDRVRAIGAAWLGQTTGCAQCHDHKFDPITMRDFYSLGAFFADIQEPLVGRREEGMLVLSDEQKTRLAELDTRLQTARKAFTAIEPFLDVAQQQWEADFAAYNGVLAELKEGAKPSDADRKAAEQVLAILKKTDRSPAEQASLRTYFRDKVTPLYPAERQELVAATQERAGYEAALPHCLVSVSTPNKRVVRILPRGNWQDESGEVMQPGLPHYLPQPPKSDGPLTRLDLANWLVSRDNPLTARTVMNRLWKQFFGTGLSKTLDDLGAQGEPPTHPELLDWLACEFMDSGWDMQHMVRLIVTSQTYRQVSTASPELLAVDPANRLLARQSTFRIDAELVRDQALAVSGLLVPTIGGPSAKPYQPPGYWENLNFPRREYVADTGPNQYRRGLYTWWQRSFLHPSLLAFDAPSREECAADRNRSNIPQQALVLLNDPTYVEAARAFAGRILQSSASSDGERITWAWQRTLQRRPTDEERNALLELLEFQRGQYRDNPTAADALLKVGQAENPAGIPAPELAAWTHIARVLLNLHETITRS
ncbi:MAG: PSD1 domain-containing protein [Planctomycetaceae bacterium]|nr:PSD1 domain-containing protein [Planctomycetaceae bacterium]